MIEFTPYPKTARLFKDGLGMVVTEKIDGTNAAVGIVNDLTGVPGEHGYNIINGPDAMSVIVRTDESLYTVYAQSRNRLIAPVAHSGNKGSDNYGFAAWVWENAEALVRVLGPGVHFGEWWGQGIGRNYGLTEKRFSLFNTSRFAHLNNPEARLSIGCPGQLSVVPVLHVGPLNTDDVLKQMDGLSYGSVAAPGFDNPEGVCVYLPSVRQTFKVTFEGDKPKWALEAAKAASGLAARMADAQYSIVGHVNLSA